MPFCKCGNFFIETKERKVCCECLYSDALKETAALKAERDNWKETAAQFARNQDYYTSLLDRISETFGKDAYISDDGSVQDSPLRAKMPELVCTLKAERDRLREALEKLAILGNEPLPGNSIRNVIAQKALAGIDKLRAELVDKCAEIKKSEIANPHYCIARLEEQVDNLMSVLDDNKTLIDAQIKEIAALKADIVLNSQLLARQCDLAREAETERDALRKQCESLESEGGLRNE